MDQKINNDESKLPLGLSRNNDILGPTIPNNSKLSSSSANKDPPPELLQNRIGGKYVIGTKIGSGAFGDIFIGNSFYYYDF
jgi:hypothetical protein